MTHELDSLETFTEPQRIGPQAQLTVGPCLGQLGGLHPQTLRVFGPGQSFFWRPWRHTQTVRLSGPRQSFTFIRSMSCTTGRHPQTLRGSGPRRSFKFRRSMPWKAWRSTSTNSQSVLASDRASSSDGPCLLQLGDTHRPSEGLAPDRASSSDGPCLGQPGGLHPQTLRAFGPWQRASRPPTTWD